eukprot:jgi/Bigna1/87653/estExt_fgenesh1_pg.C_220180
MWKRGLASSFVIATTLMRSFITHANIFQRLAISTQSRQGPLSLRCCKRLRISTSPLQCTKSSFKEGGRGSRIFNTQLATYASKLKGGQGKSAASAKPGREKEIEVSQRGFTCIIGVDEAGRGPIAGPVVAAACHIPLHVNLEKEKGIILKDSKKLSEKKREEIFEELTSHPQCAPGRSFLTTESTRLIFFRLPLRPWIKQYQDWTALPIMFWWMEIWYPKYGPQARRRRRR